MDYLATVSTQYRKANPETELELTALFYKRTAIELLIEEINENADKEDEVLKNQASLPTNNNITVR